MKAPIVPGLGLEQDGEIEDILAMRLKKWTAFVLALGASAFVVTPSNAKPGEQGPPAHEEDNVDRHRHDRDRGHDDERNDARAAHSDRQGMVEEGGDDEKSAVERREFRHALFERREKAILERLNRDRTQVTKEVRAAIRLHWRHLARLLRIRGLALEAKDDAVVKRVDQVIDREEKAFTARFDKLRDKGSEGGAR